MATFLLELRTEEIPAAALASAREQLAGALASRLADAGFADLEVTALSTSRRLAAWVAGLPERQPDRTERVTGPPRAAAYAADGSPTRAAEGFARKVGLDVADLELVATDKGEYLAATVTHRGRATEEILAEVVPAAVAGLRFPKTMRWGLGRHVFVRPVHGVLALLDDRVVAMELLGVASGRTTVGHRVHSPESFDLATAADYRRELAQRRVVVDPAARRRTLDARAAELAAAEGFRVHPDPALVAEHVELVEHPGLLSGRFDERYLELPPEVVVTTLRHHQKCLVLEDGDGRLAPVFLAVIDREDDPEGLIRQGNEWVIGARLADARFFFTEDRKRRLADLVPGLARLEFHRQLGSLADKAERVGELAGELSEWIGDDGNAEALTRVARLAKVDLLTHMVGEFPELQGVMGGHYLRLEGEPEAVWTAARDHYTPAGFEGDLPTSLEGRLVGAADRLDTLAAMFAVGERPTGSKDPFGLRRAAQGLVRIVAESGWDVNLETAATRAAHRAAAAADVPEAEVRTALEEFLADRVRRYLVELVGVSGDTADATMAVGWTRLPGLVARARALEGVRTEPEFRSLALAFKRVRNITEGQPDAGVDPARFELPAETELHSAALGFHERLAELVPARRLDEAFAAMAPIAEVLDRFFIDVLVMAEDEAVRANRVALLKALGRDFFTLADLSRLQVEGSET